MRAKLNSTNESLSFFNLLGKEVTPSQVLIRLTEINKYFCNHYGPGDLLAYLKGSIKPQLAVVTRWNSQLECIPKVFNK